MAPLVDHPQIQQAELLRPLAFHFHTYVWPFVIVWPIFLRYYLTPDLYEKYIGAPEWTTVWCGAIITVQSLVWLSTHWSVNLKGKFKASKASSIDEAELIKVIPIENAGSPEICTLIRDKVGGTTNTSFLFQKRRFLLNPQDKSFRTLQYAIDAEPKPALRQFQSSRGIDSQAELTRIEQHYGSNTFDIPVPTFTELFKEHAVAPFFVFQIFCVGLWMLDEFWYYSLFTLFMLVAFESTVVWQRQRTLTEFRGMSIKPYDMWVFRLGQWTEVQSDQLLPGDLVSVGRTKDDSGVACDMLLVEGTAIVNEAMLSGESTPLLKQPCSGKSTAALCLAEALNNLEFEPTVKIINETSFHLDRNQSYADMTAEKNLRGVLRSEVDRSLSKDNIVIVDSLNSIKGYRYELWCLARAVGIRYCVLHCDVDENQCREWNKKRGERGEATYDEKIFEDLVRRFETPIRHNRWDSPLFELWPSKDGIEKSNAAIIDAVLYLTKKVDSKTQDVKILQPTIATQNAHLSDANSLYEMDRATQEVINVIVEAQSKALGGPVNGISLGERLPILDIGRPVGLPELRRLRRTFIKLTGQSSLSGPPPPSDADSAKRMFVDYLNRELGTV